ncbi:SHOCT domain-containing protein [Maridesulfovibrio sp.]|uniref:SHOCT domain-containing protein n=1 Tax=Maridesulfovibrio sp. TaxID=2795000 RepID=UPI0029C9DA1C|nr:SHOCT domain-containing protein [Maridesulfovibrio sp.]
MYGCNYLGFGPGGSFMGSGLMGGGFLGMFINILIIALIAYLIFKLVQNLGNSGVTNPRKSNRKDSVQILRERFARGDIDEDEYLKRKEILED